MDFLSLPTSILCLIRTVAFIKKIKKIPDNRNKSDMRGRWERWAGLLCVCFTRVSQIPKSMKDHWTSLRKKAGQNCIFSRSRSNVKVRLEQEDSGQRQGPGDPQRGGFSIIQVRNRRPQLRQQQGSQRRGRNGDLFRNRGRGTGEAEGGGSTQDHLDWLLQCGGAGSTTAHPQAPGYS